jgi:hypothetical protein
MLEYRKIKFAYIKTWDLPQEWIDQEINNHFKELKRYYYGDVIWCHNDEELFDYYYKCPKYIETPIKNECQRIKYAIEEIGPIRYDYVDQDIVHQKTSVGDKCNYIGFVWCEENETLF